MDFNVTHDNVQWVVQGIIAFGGLWLVSKFREIQERFAKVEAEKKEEHTSRKVADDKLKAESEKSQDRLHAEIEKVLRGIEGKTTDQYKKIQATEDTVCHMSTHIAEDYVLKKELPYLVKGITNDQ